MIKMIKANLSSTSGITQTEPITQWDFGQFMEITGLDIQKDVEIHFANHGEDTAIIMMGKYEDQKWTVEIPDISLTKGTDVFVFVYESSATAGRTTRKARIPITKRAKPVGYVAPKTKDYLMHLLEEAERTITESQKIVTSATIDRQRLEAALIRSTSSGTVFHETDCAAVPPINIKLFGKGKQNTVPGNQLFDTNIITTGATVENEVITITEDSSEVYIAGESFGTDTLFILTKGQYKIGCSNSNVRISLYGTDGTTWRPMIDNTFDKELSDDLEVVGVLIRSIDGTSLLGTSFTVMLNAGDTLKPWEPYVGGEPSPNMNYPQKAEFLGESGSIGGKVLTNQLLDVSKLAAYTDSDDWMTIPIDNTDGTTIKYFTCMIPVSDLIEVGKDYLAVLEIKENTLGSEVIAVSTANSDKSQFVTTFTATNPGTYIKKVTASDDFTDSKTMTRTVLQAKAGTSGRVVFRLSIIEDTTVTADTFVYDPYTEQPFTSLTPNGLHGIPLGQTIPDAIKNSPIHMSGVYWDREQYQIADTENEDGKDVQRILENTFDGSDDERWKLETTSIGYRYSIALNTPVLISDTTNGATSMNTSSQLGRSGSTWTVPNCYTVNLVDGVYYLYISLNGTETLEEFKTLLAENPMSVYCVLADPIVTDTREEELAQFNALRMNYPNTTIVNDEGAYMEVTHVKDTQKHIEQNYVSKSELEDIKSQMAEIQQVITNL